MALSRGEGGHVVGSLPRECISEMIRSSKVDRPRARVLAMARRNSAC